MSVVKIVMVAMSVVKIVVIERGGGDEHGGGELPLWSLVTEDVKESWCFTQWLPENQCSSSFQ